MGRWQVTLIGTKGALTNMGIISIQLANRGSERARADVAGDILPANGPRFISGCSNRLVVPLRIW